MKLYPYPGEVTQAEHAALKDITAKTVEYLCWSSAWAEANSMREAAIQNFHDKPDEYNRGRMEALADISARLIERVVKA